jgi:hypothetical protein
MAVSVLGIVASEVHAFGQSLFDPWVLEQHSGI